METLRQKSIRYLSRREHSRLELKQKLLQKKFSEEDIATELNFLLQHDLQSDERFTQAYVRARKQAGFGPKRIEMELRERGVSESLIAETINAKSPEWQAQLIAIWKRKFPDPAQNQAEKAKQFRFLLQRGYDSAQIVSVIRN